MRGGKKLVGILSLTLIMALLIAVPTMAAEATADDASGEIAVVTAEIPSDDAAPGAADVTAEVPVEEGGTVRTEGGEDVTSDLSGGEPEEASAEDTREETAAAEEVSGDEASVEADAMPNAEEQTVEAEPAEDEDGIVTLSSDASEEEEDAAVSVTGVKLDKSKLTINTKDQTMQLVATVEPEDADDASVTWKSSNTKVVTVDKDGKLTAVKDGTATITVTTTDGGYTATCTVTVSLYSDGFHQDPDGSDWCYYKNGKIATGTTGLIQGTVDGTSGYWNVVKGRVSASATIVKGTVDGTSAWWYVNKKGRVDTSYTGFAKNSSGTWYAEKGKVSKKTNGVYKDATGAIGAKNSWYYVLNSKVQTDFTGLADYSNASGWWYITNGKVDRSVTTVAKNKNGWWYVKNGKVDRSYTGFAKNGSGSWYVKSGKVSKTVNGVLQDTKGAIGKKNSWYYVLNSKVQTGFTGLADYSNASGWWYITNGKVDRSYNGLAKNKNGWYYLTNGKVDRSYNGVAENSNGWWYVKKGAVDKNTVALVKVNGVWQAYRKGKLDTTYTGIAANGNGWYYVDDGTYVADEAMTYAARFVASNSSSSSSSNARLATCFRILWTEYPYLRTYGDNPSASVMSSYATDMFRDKRGNCFRYAASFACIAKALGYDARVAVGTISSVNGGMTPHGWTEVYFNGQWLICDPDMQMNYPDVNVYMVSEANYPYRHTCSARYTITVSDGVVTWK